MLRSTCLKLAPAALALVALAYSGFACAGLAAQTTSSTLPVGLDATEGNAHFFAFGVARTIVGVGPLGAAGTLGQMAFRRDGAGTQGGARQLDMKLTLSTGSLRLLYADTTRIHGSDKVVVFDQKQVRFPDWSMGAGSPAPFDFVLKFSKPFAYASGSLIWQLDYDGATSRVQARVDRQIAGAATADGVSLGAGCPSFDHVLRLENSGTGLVDSAMRVRISGTGSVANAPTWIMLDFKASRLNLASLCSPLYALPTVFAETYTTDATGALPNIYIGFPYLAALEGATIVTQLASFDTSQKGLPLRLSEGRRATMPTNRQTGVANAAYMWINPVAGTSGTFFYGGSIVAEFKP